MARGAPSSRVTATIARRAARVPDVSRTGNSARSGLTRRAAKAAMHVPPASTGMTVRSVMSARVSTAMIATGVRRIADRAGISTAARIAAMTNLGRSVDRHATLTAVRRAAKVAVSTSPGSTGATAIAIPASARVFRVRASTNRVTTALRVAGATGRSIRAANRATVRAATMRTTARSSPSGRHSAAAANTASASQISTSAHRALRLKRKRPANASPRSSRVRDFVRAAMPRTGSCRVVLR